MYLKMVQIRQPIAVHADGQVYVRESLQGLHTAMMHQLKLRNALHIAQFLFSQFARLTYIHVLQTGARTWH